MYFWKLSLFIFSTYCTWKVNGVHCSFGFDSHCMDKNNSSLCSTEQRKSNRFGTIWWRVNDDNIFRWTISLNKFPLCCYMAEGACISLHLASIICLFILSKAHNIFFTIQQTFPWGFSLETLWKKDVMLWTDSGHCDRFDILQITKYEKQFQLVI